MSFGIKTHEVSPSDRHSSGPTHLSAEQYSDISYSHITPNPTRRDISTSTYYTHISLVSTNPSVAGIDSQLELTNSHSQTTTRLEPICDLVRTHTHTHTLSPPCTRHGARAWTVSSGHPRLLLSKDDCPKHTAKYAQPADPTYMPRWMRTG